MFTTALALLYLVKLFLKTNFYAPKLILFAEKMFKILVRFGCFLSTKKQNNAACAAEKSASKVKDSQIKIDLGLASPDTNHA